MADVFISYRREDSAELAFLIKQRLEEKRFFEPGKISVFLDLEGLDKSESFPIQLSNEIAAAKVFVCILGPSILGSKWVKSEVELASRLGRTLIPVIQPGFNVNGDALPDYLEKLLECNGVEIPAQKTYLNTALDELKVLVERALHITSSPHRWLYLLVGLVIGTLLGFLINELLNVEPEETPPPPITWTVNVADGARVAQTITFIAEASRDIEGEPWVFVVPPNGRYYPQSGEPCRGLKTPATGHRWETRIGLGNETSAGELYDIVLAIAETRLDSEFVETKLMAWCRDSDYPGFEMLPNELTEVYRINDVIRTDERWADAPAVSNAQLGGRVTVTNLSNGDTVSDRVTLTGTYQDADDDIWVLVYPTFGRWYPQSENPCDGVHTQKDGASWAVPVLFGNDPGAPFDVVVVAANAEASAAFDQWQRTWCHSGFYRGLMTIDLPEGIEEKARVRVYRE
jgi:hypothetical protein